MLKSKISNTSLCMFIIAFLLYMPLRARADVATRALADKLYLSQVTCPGVIWKGYSWRDLDVVFVNTSGQLAYSWDTQSNQLESIPFLSLRHSEQHAAYTFNYDSYPKLKLIVRSDFGLQGWGSSYSFSTHEGFHLQGQKGWPTVSGKYRSMAYPINANPRYYRRMLFERLVDSLTDSSGRSQALAKYWYDKWKYNYPYEFESSLERIEGTAEYAEIMSDIISLHGCNFNLIDIVEDVSEMLRSLYADLSRGISLATESYPIGAATSFLLKLKKPNSDWQSRIAQGENPLEILFEDMNATNDQDNLSYLQEVQLAVDKLNTILSNSVDDDLSSYRNNKDVRLYLPYSWSTLNTSGITLFTKTLPDVHFESLLESDIFQPPNNHPAQKITLARDTVVFSLKEVDQSLNGCDHGQFVLVKSQDLMRLESDNYSVESKEVGGHFKAHSFVDEHNFTHLCPFE